MRLRCCIRLSVIVGVFSLVLGCVSSSTDPSFNIADLSIIKLIATPKKYHGTKIRVIGYLHLEFEGHALYLDHQSEKYALSHNSIWIELPQKMEKDIAKYNKRYVILEGRFDAMRGGHGGNHSGEILDITRLEVWRELDGSHPDANRTNAPIDPFSEQE